MKGLISGIKRMEIHDGDGLRSTVFFKGCPLKCIWCHNPESICFAPQTARFTAKCMGCGACGGENSAATAENCPTGALVHYGKAYEAEDLAELLAADKPFFDSSGGGVTLSGGECLAQPEFAAELARLLRERGIGVYIDTCGFVSRGALEGVIPYTDVFLYDIKAMDPEVHRACTGQDNRLILENLRYLSERGCEIEIRYPLVVGCNDDQCEKIGAFLRELNGIRKVKVLRYHDLAASRYEALGMENTLPAPRTEPADVQQAVEILRRYGLNAVDGTQED